jgi:hypothetical protein
VHIGCHHQHAADCAQHKKRRVWWYARRSTQNPREGKCGKAAEPEKLTAPNTFDERETRHRNTERNAERRGMCTRDPQPRHVQKTAAHIQQERGQQQRDGAELCRVHHVIGPGSGAILTIKRGPLSVGDAVRFPSWVCSRDAHPLVDPDDLGAAHLAR